MNRRMEERGRERETTAEGSAGGTWMDEHSPQHHTQGMTSETADEQLTETQRSVCVPLPLEEIACTHLQRHGCQITLFKERARITFPVGSTRTWLCTPASVTTGDRYLWVLPDGSHVYERELRYRADDCVLLFLPASEVQADDNR